MQRRVRACVVGFTVQAPAETTDRGEEAEPIDLSRPHDPATRTDDINKVSKRGGGGAPVVLVVLSRLPARARRERQGTNSRLVYGRYPRTGLLFVPPMMELMEG